MWSDNEWIIFSLSRFLSFLFFWWIFNWKLRWGWHSEQSCVGFQLISPAMCNWIWSEEFVVFDWVWRLFCDFLGILYESDWLNSATFCSGDLSRLFLKEKKFKSISISECFGFFAESPHIYCVLRKFQINSGYNLFLQ